MFSSDKVPLTLGTLSLFMHHDLHSKAQAQKHLREGNSFEDQVIEEWSIINQANSTMKRLALLTIILGVLGAALAFALYLKHSFDQNGGTSLAASGPDVPTAPGAMPAHVKGAANAPIVLEEFADFQCPSCAKIFPV